MSANKVALLFVNKTSSSSSLSNSKSDSHGLREINQHVQRSRDLEKERQSRKKIHFKSSTVPLGWMTISASPPTNRSDDTSPIDQSQSIRQDDQQKSDEAMGISVTLRDGQISRSGPRCPQMIRPVGASVEPFGHFRVAMDAEKQRILQYFVLKYFPAVTRLDITAFFGINTSESTDPAIQIIRNSLSHELHFFALLTAASTRMKYVEQYHFARVDLPERLAGATLRLLRRYLAQGRPVTQELLQSILHLFAIESYYSNWDAALMHGNMIMHLCNTYFGGFQNLNPYLRRMLWVADRFQAAATARPPLVEERWETAEVSLQQYMYAVGSLQQRGRQPSAAGFSRINEHLGSTFALVLNAVVNLARVIQCHWIGIPAHPHLPDRDWAVARSYTLSDELLSFHDDRAETTDGSRDVRFQDCIRLALIVWLAFVPASAPYSPARHPTGALTIRAAIDARPLRSRLRAVIERLDEKAPSNEVDTLLLWVAALGVVASERVENQEWFAVQFQRSARKLGVHVWDDFNKINEAYLPLDGLQQPNRTKITWLLQRAVYAESSDEEA